MPDYSTTYNTFEGQDFVLQLHFIWENFKKPNEITPLCENTLEPI